MKLYIGHSSGIDFREELYRPLQDSTLSEEHELVLPHAAGEELFDSKALFAQDCELVVAEVSQASTGLGIELGWADTYDVPILAVHRTGTTISSSIKAVTNDIVTYRDPTELPGVIQTYIDEHCGEKK